MKSRIVHIITGLSVGGAERMLLKLLIELDHTRYSITVISLTSKGAIGNEIESLGIPVLALEMGRPITILHKFVFLIKQLRFLKPDLVHTWMYHANLIGGLAATFAGVDHIVWGIRQSNLSPDLNSKNTLRIVKICSWLSTLLPEIILCNSKLALFNHKKIGYKSEKMTVIPNGFNLKEYCLNRSSRGKVYEELQLSENILLVGMVARFDSQKNHRGFFEAAGIIHASRPDTHFVLIGKNVDLNNDTLFNWAKENNVEEVVHFLGQREDIAHLLSALSVLVSSSHGESFPNVLGEAMSSGIPCVATDAGDCAEIIGDTGFVVNIGDMQSLAESALSLLNMPTKMRMDLGGKARNRIEQYYDITHIVEEYDCLYRNMIGDIT